MVLRSLSRARFLSLLLALILLFPAPSRGNQYKNFRVAVYIPIFVVTQMRDPKYLESSWDIISKQVKVDKVYIETHRNRQLADEQLLEQIKTFFTDHGVEVAGGIAFTSSEPSLFQSFCYTDPEDRDYVKKISELTARHFDEIILDDFFFVNSKKDSDIAAKGAKSWTDFRLGLMDDAAQNLVISPIKAVNPKAKVVIKFPNWYEHFPGLGFDLDKEPRLFDGIYTGTETRDPNTTDQHLQQYESYQAYRYFENIKPGGNGGGWVDMFGIRYIDRYAEQLWDTMFAKAPEITLFFYGGLLQPITPGARDWKDLPTSFNYDRMTVYRDPNRATTPTIARVAGYSLDQVDGIVGQLGKPIGIKSYKPYQSHGDDYLHNFLGMIGIPIDLSPNFPADAETTLLTEAAKVDADIVSKIKTQLQNGKNVIITSALLEALQDKGMNDIVELRYTGRSVAIRDYLRVFGGMQPPSDTPKQNPEILIPEIRFLTNDAWALVRGLNAGNGFPILIMDRYSKGTLFILNVPSNFADLYNMPPEALDAIRSYIFGTFPVRLDGPAQVSLFAYDNQTFVVESFSDKPVDVSVSIIGDPTKIKNLITGEVFNAEPAPKPSPFRISIGPIRTRFKFSVPPHSYIAFSESK